jgi:hypothetical protein
VKFNRRPVTVRFNIDEQKNLRSLCAFWGVDERKVLKIAFEQLVIATDQLQNKLKEKGLANEEPNQVDGAAPVSSDSGSDPVQQDSVSPEQQSVAS